MNEEYRYLVECPINYTQKILIKSDKILKENEVVEKAKEKAKELKIYHKIFWEKVFYYPLSREHWNFYEEE